MARSAVCPQNRFGLAIIRLPMSGQYITCQPAHQTAREALAGLQPVGRWLRPSLRVGTLELLVLWLHGPFWRPTELSSVSRFPPPWLHPALPVKPSRGPHPRGLDLRCAESSADEPD